MTKAILPDGRQVTYKYDAFGRRIKKTVTDKSGKPTTTEFLWQGDNLIAETDNKEHYQSYIYEPNSFKPLALIVGRGKEHKVYHYQLDHIGTPTDLTDTKGKAVWSAQYLAYGTIYTQHTEEVTNPLRFQGQYFDQETGLHYNRHRYYNPKNGLFTTADPIGLAGGLNNYQYVKNPTGFVDPLGLAQSKGYCTCGNNSLDNQSTTANLNEDRRVLNIGSGTNPMKDAINVDIRIIEGVDIVADATSLPFKSNLFNEVHSINPYGFNPVSAETARVMQLGGILQVTGNATRNSFARPLSAKAAKEAGFEIIDTGPVLATHSFGVQRATSGKPLDTSFSTTTTYKKIK